MLSVIIPTYNEEGHLKATLEILRANESQRLIKEIIITDGGSTDNTQIEAAQHGVVFVKSPVKGRAGQMNYGASLATGSIFYFLHADTAPASHFSSEIIKAVKQGYSAGCYRLAFDYPHWFLKLNCWFTRFDVNTFRFGDQSLFITKEKFEESGGFCEKHLVMEDQNMIRRLKKISQFKIMPESVVTSARKYLENGVFKTQGIFFLIYLLYQLGISQPLLIHIYRRLIKQDKL